MLSRRSLLKQAGAAALATAELRARGAAMDANAATSALPVRGAFAAPDFEVCLNNARWHPLSHGARQATEDYLTYKSRGVVTQAGLVSPAAIAVKAAFATLIHAAPDDIAFVPSTTAGENLVVSALGLTEPGAFNIVTDALHFEGSLYLYTELARRGVEVRIVKPRGWVVEKADLAQAVDKRTRLIAVSQVSWVNGATQDPRWLAELAHAHGARMYLDAVQAAGVVPIDVRASGVDFLATASYKWLMGDFGLGFLYARADVLPTLKRTQWSFRQFAEMDYHALPGDAAGPYPASFEQLHNAAGYFELGTYANSVLAALSYSLPWINRVGVEAIQQHAHSLIAHLRSELPRLGYACITPEDAAGSIVSFAVRDDTATAARLKARKVDVALVKGRMRVSPSVYNDAADVEALLAALA